MTQKKPGLLVIVLFLALCIIAACTSDSNSSLIGKWKSSSAEGWEFRSDNKFERMDPLGFTLTGTYSINGEVVVLKFDPRDEESKAPEPLKVNITVRGDEMSLNDGERKYTYKRASANEKSEGGNLNTSTTNTSTTNTSNSSIPKQSSGVIQARDLLENQYNEDNPSKPLRKEGENVTVTGSFEEYTPQLPQGKTIWFSDKVLDNGARLACRITDSEDLAATKLKKNQKITVNGTVGKHEYGFYLDLTNCKIVNQ